METAAYYSKLCLYAGLFYLQAMVLYSLIEYDAGPLVSSVWQSPPPKRPLHHPSTTAQASAAIRYHYQTRGTASYAYRLVPVACVSLTMGLLGNVCFHFLGQSSSSSSSSLSDTAAERSSGWGPILALIVGFATAWNNGQNVVNPANALTKSSAVDAIVLQQQIAWGHVVDVVGFTILYLCVTFL